MSKSVQGKKGRKDQKRGVSRRDRFEESGNSLSSVSGQELEEEAIKKLSFKGESIIQVFLNLL